MKLIKIVAFACLGGTLSLALPACSSEASDACKALCDCEGCTSAQKSACEDEFNSARHQADDYNCESKFDDNAQCNLDRATCVNHKLSVPNNSCNPQQMILDQCRSGASTL